jgi:hypothetical protein
MVEDQWLLFFMGEAKRTMTNTARSAAAERQYH